MWLTLTLLHTIVSQMVAVNKPDKGQHKEEEAESIGLTFAINNQAQDDAGSAVERFLGGFPKLTSPICLGT